MRLSGRTLFIGQSQNSNKSPITQKMNNNNADLSMIKV